MKQLISILAIIAMAIGITASAQSNPRYAYVKKSNVNIRATPSTKGRVLDKAQEGYVYYAGLDKGDWMEVCYDIFNEENGYISKSMVDVVEACPFPEDKLNSTFTFDRDGAIGVLNFTRKGDNVVYDYYIKDKELVRNGGSGIIERGSDEVGYNADFGELFQPSTWFCGIENVSGIPYAIYDSKTGKLIFGGFLWTAEN